MPPCCRRSPRLGSTWLHGGCAVTGGIGALPVIEGFGRDYELDPEVMYAETCAALGCMFWNREMALMTGEAKYDDLFEWQLYNAAAGRHECRRLQLSLQ